MLDGKTIAVDRDFLGLAVFAFKRTDDFAVQFKLHVRDVPAGNLDVFRGMPGFDGTFFQG